MKENIQTGLLLLLAMSPLLICLLVWLIWFRKKAEKKDQFKSEKKAKTKSEHPIKWGSIVGWILIIIVLIWTVWLGYEYWQGDRSKVPLFLLIPLSLPFANWLLTKKHESATIRFYTIFSIPVAICALVYNHGLKLQKSQAEVEQLASSPIHSSAELEALQIRRGSTEIKDWTGWFSPLKSSRWRPGDVKLDWGFGTLTFVALSMSRNEFFSVTVSNIPGGLNAEGKWHWYSSDKTHHIEGKATLSTLLPESADRYGPVGGVLHDLPQRGMDGPKEDLPFSLVPADRKEFMRKILR